MAQLGWYLRRLHKMNGPELLFRLQQAAAGVSLSFQHHLGTGLARPVGSTPEPAFCRGEACRLPPLSLDLNSLQAAAPDLLDGCTPLAGSSWRWERTPDAWHRAPDTGRLWPRGYFGRIPHLHGNPYGEARQLWEPARLQQLVDLAALAQTGDAALAEDAACLAEAQLVSFVAQNPPLDGPHYISAMECALRILACCHALDMLREHLTGPAPWHALTQLVASHATLIERRLSLHSSTGNHTVAEAAGLTYAGLVFPEMRDAARWRDRGLGLLEALAASQVLPDGGGAEQAPSYHLFNLHLFFLVGRLLEHLGQVVPPAITAAVTSGTGFIEALDTGHGSLPSIGDSDGGFALSRFLRLPPSGLDRGQIVHFPQSGYTVVPIAADARMIFDHGPLGMPPSFGHGHADSLSLQLYAGGVPVLIDPGTYTYTGDPEWRRYFRGTRAHNTVCVDGRDQARQDGAFLWSRPFHSRVVAVELNDPRQGRLLAEHDGYCSLGLRHFRGVTWERDAWIFVWDALVGAGTHALELHWQLGVAPTLVNQDTIRLAVADAEWLLQCTGGALSLHTAEKSSGRGWQSPAFGVLEPGNTLRVSFTGRTPHNFETVISIKGRRPCAQTLEACRKWMQDLAR